MSGEIINNGMDQSGLHDAEIFAQQQIAEELNQTIEALRVSDNPAATLDSLKKLNLSPSDLRARLNAAFNVAINSQAHVETRAQQGADDEELAELQAQADVVSKLVAHMGVENKAVENAHSSKRKTISAAEYKLDQVESFMDFFQTQNPDPVRFRAVQRIAQVGYEFNDKRSFARSVIEKPLIAQTASALALTALISLANNGSPAAAANEKTTTIPTQPGADENDMLTRNVVKITKNKVNPVVNKVDVTPQQDAPTAKKVVTIKETAPKTIVQVQPEPKPQPDSAPVVIREKKQKTLEIKTLPPAESKNNVRVIPPAPLAPPSTSVEAAPAAPAPAPAEVAPQPGVRAEIEAARQLANMEGLNPKGTSWKNAGLAIEYMLNKGLTDNQAIGVVANMMWESEGVNPAKLQADVGPAFGLVQWEASRRTEMENFLKNQGKPVDDFYGQLDFMMLELERDAWNGYAELKQAKNATEAMIIFEEKFERAGSPAIKERKALVVAITNAYNAKLDAVNAARQPAPAAPKTETIAHSEGEVEPFTKWHFPVPEGHKITSEFGPRGDALHGGFDLNTGSGVPFIAASGGKVSVIVSGDVRQQLWCQKALAGFGASVADVSDPFQKEVHVTTVIDGVEYVTIYAHMSEVTVAPGQIVKAGEVLGKTGDSGCSTGPHAHFEVRKNGKPINPRLLFDGDKWRGAGSSIPAGETSDNSEDVEGLATAVGDGAHDRFCGCGNHTPANNAPEPAPNTQVAETPRQHRVEKELDTMQEVIALQKEIEAREQRNGQLVKGEGYLSVPR